MSQKKDGGDASATATIELPFVPELKEEAKPTVAEISDGSFTKDEIEAAKRHGLVVEEPKKEEKKTEPEKPEEKSKPEEKPKEEPAPKPVEDDFKLDEDKEKQFQEIFGENKTVSKLYGRMKKDRTKRQNAEADRDQVLIQKKALEEEREKLRQELEAAKKQPKRTGDDDLNLDDLSGGDANDRDSKPLTRADLAQIEKEKADRAAQEHSEKTKKAEKLNERLDDFYDDAKVRHKDFDSVLDLTQDVMQNLETLFPDKREQQKVVTKIRTFLDAAANADKYDVDTFNPADMAYEVGQLHPKYKAGGTAGDSSDSADQGEDLTPDKLKRIANNASRRTSASINGGAGRRMISVENLTAAELAALPPDEFRKLRKDHPHVVERLLRQ